MRKFRSRFGTVDLDSPKTYKYLPKDPKALDNLMFTEIGKSLVYMDFILTRKGLYHKKKLEVTPGFMRRRGFVVKREADLFLNSGYYQRQRVYKLIKEFVAGRQKQRPKAENVKWLREQVFMFQNETENQC